MTLILTLILTLMLMLILILILILTLTLILFCHAGVPCRNQEAETAKVNKALEKVNQAGSMGSGYGGDHFLTSHSISYTTTRIICD